jgi:hypothetical protein
MTEEWLVVLLRIWKFPGLNIDLETAILTEAFRDFS